MTENSSRRPETPPALPVEGRCIICFGDDWGRHPQTLEHLVRILATCNTVIWVNSLGHRAPHVSMKDARRAFEKIRNAIRPHPRSSAEEILVIRPLAIPLHDVRIVRRLNAWLLKRILLRHLKVRGCRAPILMTNSPVITELVGALGESAVVYYCLDDYTAFDGTLKNMAAIEREMLGKSDVAFFVSDRLLQSRLPLPRYSGVIPQGVDTRHFRFQEAARPGKLGMIRGPIAGFMGYIESWVDLDLVADIARTRPDWSLVMVGPWSIDVKPYRSIPNLHFLGPIAYGELPEYAGAFDVGLIPFKVNNVTIASNPLKLLEYFSMGMPVVSTPLPEVQKFQPHVTIASGTAEFVRGIEDALRSDRAEERRARRGLALARSWRGVLHDQMTLVRKAEESRRERGAATAGHRLPK